VPLLPRNPARPSVIMPSEPPEQGAQMAANGPSERLEERILGLLNRGVEAFRPFRPRRRDLNDVSATLLLDVDAIDDAVAARVLVSCKAETTHGIARQVLQRPWKAKTPDLIRTEHLDFHDPSGVDAEDIKGRCSMGFPAPARNVVGRRRQPICH
jgi:hypothetical protein